MKKPRAKIPATPAARKLHAKLSALAAAPGTPAEGQAAAHKLARLLERYSFGQNDVTKDKESLFAGRFCPAPEGRLVLPLADPAIAFWVKWAIEESTQIRCAFRGADFYASASPKTCEKLAGIARTIADGFTQLWDRFRTFPAVPAEARSIFFRGLYDGMMSDAKPPGQSLPQTAGVEAPKKAKRRAVGRVAGMELHPYSIASDLGKQIRFTVPLPDICTQLESLRPVIPSQSRLAISSSKP